MSGVGTLLEYHVAYASIMQLLWEALATLRKRIFVQPGFILWCHWLPLYWTNPMGFKTRLVTWSLAYPCVEPKDHAWCYTCLSTNRGVHCLSVYTAGLPVRYHSCKQWKASSGGLLTWAAVRIDLSLAVHQASIRVGGLLQFHIYVYLCIFVVLIIKIN